MLRKSSFYKSPRRSRTIRKRSRKRSPRKKPLIKNHKKPYFIITSGSTGSGKTGLINATLKYLGIDRIPYTKILIDDLIENDEEYKRKVKSIIEKIDNLCRLEKKFCLDEKCDNCNTSVYYNNPSKELYDEFNRAYFDVRAKYNKLNDLKIREAIAAGQNIVFETVGTYIVLSWLYEFISEVYNVVFSYSLVSVNNLTSRNISRAYKAVQMFTKDPSSPAPRLPDVSFSALKSNVRKIYDVLIDLYDSCIKENDTAKCKDRKIDKLLIFDNNGKTLNLIFDSKKYPNVSKEDFINLINPSFYLM